MEPYFLVLFLGLTFSVIGAIVLFIVYRFLHTNRSKHIVIGLIFLIGGVGIISIAMFGLPSPEHQRGLRKNMLNLPLEKVDQITVFNRKTLSESMVRIQDQEEIDEWVTILKTCQQFFPNHPRYDNEYMAIVSHNEDDYLNSFQIMYIRR